MKFCPECGAKLENETAKFCPECGKSISASEKSEVKKAVNPLMEEYEYEVMPDGTYAIIKPKDKYKTKYVIPEGVSIIRKEAFSEDNATVYEEVVMPNSIRIIEEFAFASKNLVSINFPKGLEVIGERAFACTKISTIYLPDGLRVLGVGAFEYSKIETISLPNTFKKLDDSVFEGSIIKRINIPGSIECIGNNHFDPTFAGAQIGEIVLEEGVKRIGENAFARAVIGTIQIPSSVKKIGKDTFGGAKINKITFAEGFELKDCVFWRAEISEITLPASVKCIGFRVFHSCKIGKIIFSEGLESISDEAFYESTLPETMHLPKTLVNIAETAFAHSYGFKKIVYDGEAKINVSSNVKVEKPSIVQEKRDNGIAFLCGKTNDKSLKKVVSGNVVFYLDNYNYCGDHTAWEIVGIESADNIECLEIPNGNIRHIDSSCIENIKRLILPRDMKDIIINTMRMDLQFADFDNSGVVQIVVPKEAETFYVRDVYDLGTIREIKFEDPAGWGLSMDTIGHPECMYYHIFGKGGCELKKRTGIGGMFKKLFGGR